MTTVLPTGPRAGFIGLGAMGHSMAGHLADRGLLAVVGNRTSAKAQAFADGRAGVTAATAFGDYAGCDVVALCVSADADVLAALRASGDGWQTRVNEMLRASLRLSGTLTTPSNHPRS